MASTATRIVLDRPDNGHPRRRESAQAKAPAEAGALSAAGFANRKGIFHARFPVLP